jgi:ankyrin repeat protein
MSDRHWAKEIYGNVNNDNYDLIRASLFGDTNVVEKLLKAGVDPNTKNEIGDTVLSLASKYGFTKIVELLLKAGANVNLQNKNRWTALMFASKSGYTKIVELLLTNNNVTVNLKDKFGWTALMLASFHGHTNVVKLLLNKKADFNIRDINGYTAYDLTTTDEIKKLLT